MAPTGKAKHADLVAEVIQDVIASEQFRTLLQDCIERAFEVKCGHILQTIEENSGKILELQTKYDQSAGQIKHLDQKVESLNDQCDTFRKEINELEQYSRRNCVRIFGVAEKPNENIAEVIVDLAKSQLKLDLSPSSIDRCHRLGKLENSKSQSRSIIVKFTSYATREQFIKSRRLLKGTRIVIKEDLTKANLSLLSITKEHPKVKSAWTQDGRVLAEIPSTNGGHIIRRIWGTNDLRKL